MAVTVGVNNMSVVHKSSNGITIAFPDVCKSPVPVGGGVPIPYPNIAKSATAAQKSNKTKVTTKKVVTKGSAYSKSYGDQPGTLRGKVSSKNVSQHAGEIQQLKGMLNGLHNKLQAMKSNDPNEWQAVLQDYAVAASALYMTQNSS